MIEVAVISAVSPSADQLSVVPAATRDGGVPALGWARVAMVLRPLQAESSATVVIELVAAGQIVIDWGRRVYWWSLQPTTFPLTPTVARIRMARGEGADVPFMQEQPGRLDALLWHVGHAAFDGEPAWWLASGDRYRLAQWPNFTELAHDPDDVRQTALLSSAPLSIAELAALAQVEVHVATSLINALSFMGLLTAEAAPVVLVEQPIAAPVKRGGLFARLRTRLDR